MKKNIVVAFLLACLLAACYQYKAAEVFRPKFNTAFAYPSVEGIITADVYRQLQQAIDMGANTLLLPAAVTLDSQVVVARLRRANLHNSISQTNFAVLQSGSTFPDIQLAKVTAALLDYARSHKKEIQVHVQIQSEDYRIADSIQHIAAPVWNALKHDSLFNRYIVMASYDTRALRWVHFQDRKANTAFYIAARNNDPNDQILAQLGYAPTYFKLDANRLSEITFREIFQNKISAIADNVNDDRTLAKMKKLGVEGVVTYKPEILAQTE